LLANAAAALIMAVSVPSRPPGGHEWAKADIPARDSAKVV